MIVERRRGTDARGCHGMPGLSFQIAPDPRFFFRTAGPAHPILRLFPGLRRQDAAVAGKTGAGRTIFAATVTVAIIGWQHASLADAVGPTGVTLAEEDSPGVDVGGTGNIRGLLGTLLGASTSEVKPLSVDLSFGVQELATDNVLQRSRPRRADLVTSLLPQITITGQSQWLQANVDYAPSIQLYAQTSQQNQVAQQFSGQTLVTAQPETLFLELHGYGTQQSSTGGLGPNGLPYYALQNRTDTVALEVSPYVTHRFSGDGTFQAGYVFNYTDQSASSGSSLADTQSLFGGNPGQYPASGATRSDKEYATFTTGENLGRFNGVARVEDTRYSGNGNAVLAGAHQSVATVDLGYGLDRVVALLGTAGAEDIAYSGQPRIRIQDAVWSAGVRLTPNENSKVTIKYGHKDGFNSLALASSYAVTSRLRVFANYSEGLTSSQQEIQDNLDNSAVDQFGNTISTATGAPTVIADQLLAPQNALYRLRRASLTAVSTYDRDVFSLTVERENRALVASGAAGPNYSDHGISADFTWSRAITSALNGTAEIRYARTVTPATTAQVTQAAGLVLQTSYALSPTLTGTVQYSLSNQSSNLGGQSFLQNAFTIGLRKAL